MAESDPSLPFPQPFASLAATERCLAPDASFAALSSLSRRHVGRHPALASSRAFQGKPGLPQKSINPDCVAASRCR
jgi:hypothetical protein